MSHDSAAATELALFIENDGDLYRQQVVSIHKNLITKMARGIYNHDKAVKLMGYLMEAGAKKYAREYGGTWNYIFSVATRKYVAEEFTKAFEQEAKYGNYDNYLPKKYQKTKTNPSRVRRARSAIRGMGRVRRKRMIHTALGTMMNPKRSNPYRGREPYESEKGTALLRHFALLKRQGKFGQSYGEPGSYDGALSLCSLFNDAQSGSLYRSDADHKECKRVAMLCQRIRTNHYGSRISETADGAWYVSRRNPGKTRNNPRRKRITKREYYDRGGMANSRLFRKARKNGVWQYFSV